MSDFGTKNSSRRSRWYSDVINPLGKAVRDAGGHYKAMGSASGWKGLNDIRYNLQNTSGGRTWHGRITENWRELADITGLPHDDLKWNTLNKAKAHLAKFVAEITPVEEPSTGGKSGGGGLQAKLQDYLARNRALAEKVTWEEEQAAAAVIADEEEAQGSTSSASTGQDEEMWNSAMLFEEEVPFYKKPLVIGGTIAGISAAILGFMLMGGDEE